MIKIQVLNNLEYDIEKKEFENCTITDFSRYLKGQYGNVNRLNERFFNSLTNPLAKELKKQVYDIFDEITPFTYVEAFEIKNDMFKSLVFGSINIVEMIKELGSKRIKTDGKRVVRKQYDFEGKYIGDKEYDNIYETYEVSGKKLGVDRKLYVVKCWCTSTDKEHYIWIDEKYKNNPLDAIASTFQIHENVIPYIKCLKRQGDIMICEMNEEVTPIGNKRPLTSDEYFNLLVAES